MSAVNIHSPGEKCSACSVNYTVRRELSGSKQPDPAAVWETIEQWRPSAFPAAICVMLLTINHLFIAAGLQLLTHQPLAQTPVGQVIVITHEIVADPLLSSVFSSSDLEEELFFPRSSVVLIVIVLKVFILSTPPAYTLTLFSSRLLQTFPGAVWKALHDAQEHAEALRRPRQLLRLWPPLGQHGGFLWRSGQLPRPLHGESHMKNPRFSTFPRVHTHKQQLPPTPTLFYTYICSLTHTFGVIEQPVCVSAWGRRSSMRVKTCLRMTVLQSQPSVMPARLARGEDFPAFLSNFCPLFGSKRSEAVSSRQKVFLLLEFTASPHQFAQHWHAWMAHLLCEFLHMSSKN